MLFSYLITGWSQTYDNKIPVKYEIFPEMYNQNMFVIEGPIVTGFEAKYFKLY